MFAETSITFASEVEDGSQLSESSHQSGHEARRLVRKSIKELSSQTVGVRYRAAEKLATCGGRAADAIDILETILLSDENALVRKSAAFALGEIGISTASDALRHARDHDDDAFVRKMAAESVQQLVPRAALISL
mmetsp:Transcript_9179/g.15001  ORF Transcript_9179/g.15001 Transcript_9179/m.15001 type:complete len:135 (+) Transcript_9179:53-457(+)